jgi:hypothetical protein
MGINWYEKDIFNLFLDAMKIGTIPDEYPYTFANRSNTSHSSGRNLGAF